jgi:hypothetical protein
MVRQNCGRRSQSQHHPVGKQFALARQFFGDPIENQIKMTSPAIVTSKRGIVRPCLYNDYFCLSNEQTTAHAVHRAVGAAVSGAIRIR